jgi:hypothetical protein
MEHKVETRTFGKPDDQLNFQEHGKIDVVKLSDGTAGMLATLKPGWKWAIDEKPLLGNPESCPMPHTGYCLSGEVVIQMTKTGQETCIRKGDFFVIPAEHDAYVPGDQTCELILFQAPETKSAESAA